MTLRKGKPWEPQPLKLVKESEEIPVSIDLDSLVKALKPLLEKDETLKKHESNNLESKSESKLVMYLVALCVILGIAFLCALISLLSAASYSRSLEKLLLR